MSTLIVAGARAGAQALSQGLGQALVQTASQAALSFANSAISQLFDTRTLEGPRLRSFQLMSSRDGTPIPRSYGRVRLAGQVIWASRLKEVVSEKRGGKGGPTVREYNYTISFAIALCEGEIQSVDRFWVNGQILRMAGLTCRIYNGTETQSPDPIISAIDGDVPAYRGTAYAVFEDFPLDDYGARLPQINAEVTRVPPSTSDEPRLETLVTGVHLLPSSGEFAYAADIIEDISSPGAAKPINMNNISGDSDIVRALDQLETALPECKNVSLVISWFGDDLRLGHCKLRPGAETATRLIDGGTWQVCGQTRESAYLISTDSEGRPVYGGTPSDASILQAITTLKARGYKVMLYPFILMDIQAGNGLPDPYGDIEQAAFPWRGRITCHPAFGQDGSADETAEAAAQVDSFFGSAQPSDFGQSGTDVTYSGSQTGLRRFILHYAKLAQIAGGVERFVISSEMVGLTTVRSSRTDYPAVDKFKDLLADVRALLPDAQLSYAADWSEYFGHHPQDGRGDVNFHLDALWADDNLDAVGIDAYFPLSDWRGGSHADAEKSDNIYDLDYLRGNLRGGEGFDFYYASEEDRQAQSRSVTSDLAYQKSWVFRYKDLFNWWHQPHITRQDGIETSASPWVPRSKPFWLTEIGCPAVDRRSNQPNVFYDPKSRESALPHHSAGTRDDLIQRRYLEAFISFYSGSKNPASDKYNGRMIDTDATHVWCWDARPYPDFPARQDVWADGPNWELGHWLTGRTGLVLVADVVRDLAVKSGVSAVDVSDISGVLEGYILDRPMSARAALGPLSMIYGFDMVERASGITFRSSAGGADMNLTMKDIAQDDAAQPAILRTKDDPEGRIKDVRLYYIDGARDHQTASLFARNVAAQTPRILDAEVPIVMDAGFARVSAERLLLRAVTIDQSLQFSLSPLRLDIEVGDKLTVPEQSGVWQITRLEQPGTRGGPARVTAQASGDVSEPNPQVSRLTPLTLPPVPWSPKPQIVFLDIPNLGGTSSRLGPLVGAAIDPFNRADISSGTDRVSTSQPVLLGKLTTPLPLGPVGRIDLANAFEFTMRGAELSSIGDEALLTGGSLFAVQSKEGWELLQAANLDLIGDNKYRAGRLLRGQFGSDDDMTEIEMGAQIVWLGQGFVTLPTSAEIGARIVLSATAAGRDSDPLTAHCQARHLRPLSPVHGRITRSGAGQLVSWTRRTRVGGDSWSGLDVPLGEDVSLFRIQALKDGAVIATYQVATTSFLLEAIEVNEVQISQGSTAYGFGPSLVIALAE